MDDNKLKFGVGVLVVAAMGIAIILTFLFGAFPTVFNREYTLFVRFPSAEGVDIDSPVFRDGVRVGRVANIKLMDGIDEDGVLMTLSMDSKKPLTHRYYPRISNGSLVTGDAMVEFVRGTDEVLARKLNNNLDLIPQPYLDQESIDYGEKANDPIRVFVDMQDEMLATMQSIQQAGDIVRDVGTNVNMLVNDVRQVVGGTDATVRDVTRETVETLEMFQGAIQDVRSIIGDPNVRQNLQQSIARIPQLLEEAEQTLKSTQQTFQSFEQVGEQFEKVGIAAEKTVASVGRTVDNVERFTQPLGDRGGELIEQVLVTLRDLDKALVQVDTFGQALNNSDGTLRRLLEDDELYWQIQRTVENIEQASVKIRPILDDVRIFTDKVARDPRELGVRGAITKRPSGMGLK